MSETWLQELARKSREKQVQPVVTLDSNVRQERVEPRSNVRQARFDKAAYQKDYMKKYRAREKKCPHCGGEL